MLDGVREMRATVMRTLWCAGKTRDCSVWEEVFSWSNAFIALLFVGFSLFDDLWSCALICVFSFAIFSLLIFLFLFTKSRLHHASCVWKISLCNSVFCFSWWKKLWILCENWWSDFVETLRKKMGKLNDKLAKENYILCVWNSVNQFIRDILFSSTTKIRVLCEILSQSQPSDSFWIAETESEN